MTIIQPKVADLAAEWAAELAALLAGLSQDPSAQWAGGPLQTPPSRRGPSRQQRRGLRGQSATPTLQEVLQQLT